MRSYLLGAFVAVMSVTGAAQAQTTTSPTGGALPAAVTKVGGIVADLKGTNGTRVVAQVAASDLYRDFANAPTNPQIGNAGGNPLLIGTQFGFTPTLLANFGGGLASASFRITLFDGDTAAGDFDFNDNTFSVNGGLIGNWSSVTTFLTDATGTTVSSPGLGFNDNQLRTGFFSTLDPTVLGSIFAGLTANGSLAYTLLDADANDNFFDFTQGVDGGLINVGSGPVVTPPGAVPEPATWAMMLAGFGAMGFAMRRRGKVSTAVRFA